MKLSLFITSVIAAAVESHGIFQKISVNGNAKGSLEGLRAPSTNNPVTDVTSNSLICGAAGTTSQAVVAANPGDKIGTWFQHVIGGPQFPNDPDNPIASSHHGPVLAYMAKVDNAASSSHTGLKWFKIGQDTFDTSSKKWGVDNLIANNGWAYFSLPSCLAPGQYLMRVEIIALHSAYSRNGAQFYSSCLQLNVGGSGSSTPSPAVSFPFYGQGDPGIQTNIYGAAGAADNNGQAYAAPGPAVATC
ncbi:putative cellulose-growth-specific protein [Diaporthe ampelina]|uniref:lytic cellulose monooxygenase (C4-dehydrogenating) n=1 Tax=Diaporthe ampelina TaxID=1214573 RepID=A0A0G2HGV4_9PEZI|nr:putative cellulose-growth-specific protein [Diaporthe ampelina]